MIWLSELFINNLFNSNSITSAFMKQDINKLQQKNILRKALLTCGILSSLLYVAMLIFVPMKYEGYSFVTQTISELSAIGAPTRPLWVPLGIIYTLLIAAFGIGVWQSADENRPLRISGTLLSTYGVIGIGWVFAPMHQREVLAAGGGTISDTMHLVMGAVSNLFMLVSMGFAAAAFGKWFRFYSITTILLLLVFGALTGMDSPNVEANLPTPWLGVWERIMLSVFMLWAVVLAIIILRKEKSANPLTVAAKTEFKENVKHHGQQQSKKQQTEFYIIFN
jgi:hypothetical protein